MSIKAKKILLKKFKIQHTGVVYVETKENLICVFNQGEKINLLLKFFKNLNTQYLKLHGGDSRLIVYINNFNKHIEKFEFKNYTLYIDIDTIVFLGSLTNTQISIDKLTIFLIFKKFKTNSFNAHYLQKTMNNFENYFKLLKFVILNSPIFSKLTNEDEFDIIKIKFKTTINTYNKKYLCLKHNEKEFFNVYSVIHKLLTNIKILKFEKNEIKDFENEITMLKLENFWH